MTPIPGYEGYLVTRDGRVFSTRRAKTRELRIKIGTDGYPRVALNQKWVLLHRLVLTAFRGPCPDGMVGRHLDGNPLNASFHNLSWSTQGENLRDKRRHGTDHNVNKTHCAKGHPYDEENTYMRPDRPGSRGCRACNREIKRVAP